MAIYGNMVVPSKAAGGALPTDNSDRNVYVPGTEVSARYSDAGGVLAAQGQQKAAEGLGNLGKGLGALGGMGFAFYTRQRRIEHAEAMEAVARLQTEYVEKQREWSQIKGANAINMEELKSRWWDEAIPRYTEGLSDYGKRYFNLNADRVGALADTFIQNHQEREIGQYEGQQLKLAMDSEGNMIAANPFDPAAAAASQGRIRGLIHQEAVRKGWTPEMEEQAFLAASGKTWGNAIAVRISMGDFDGAQALMQQYGASVSPEDQAKLRQAWSSGKMGLIASKAAAGDIDGVRRELGAGQGLGGSFDATIAARAVQFNGRKYGGVGGFDCSAYIRTIGKDQVPAQYQDIFAGSSEHMLDRAGELTGHLYRGGEVNAGTITSGGWLIGIAEPNARHVRATKSERPNDIGHVAMTFMQNGVVMVTENASGRGVNSVPLAEYLDRYKGSRLFAANLNALPQGGGLPGGYKGVPSGWVEFQGDRTGSKAARQHNPGNIRHDGKNYDSYATDAEGWLDMASVLQKPGYRNLTVQQIAERYVNGKVGHAVVPEYLKAIQAQGFKLDEVPDLNDKMTLARLMKGMAVGESPLGKEYKVEQLYGLLTGGAQPQQQAPAQAVPAGVDQSKWDTLFQNTGGDAELAAVGYKLGLAKAMEWDAGGRKAKSLPKDVLAFLQEVKANGGKPKAGAVVQAPAPAQGAQPVMPQAGAQQTSAMGAGFRLTEAERQRVQNDLEPQAHANDIWKRLEVLPLEQLDAGLARELDAFSDNPTLQAKISHYLANNVSNRKKTLEAESKQRVADCAANIKSDNYLGAANTVSQLVANKKISEKEGALALELAFGKKEDNLKSRSAASQVLEDIDRGNITSRQQIEAACLAGRCTEEQTKKCLDYFDKGGQKGQVKWERINSVWKDWKESQGQSVGTGEKIPWELANYVYADMTPGKIPSSEEIRKSIAEGMMKGRGWGSNYAYKGWAKKNEDWEVDELPPAFNGDRKEYWKHVDKWILANVSGITEDDITDPMRRAAAREMTGMPRWGFDWSKVNKGGSR